MTEIINPNNPVYFTYARNSDEKAEWRHIADVVPDLLDAFRCEGVKYSVDKEDIKNGEKISSYEKKIGDADYVIVVLSDRYFYRNHCMFELSNVLKDTQGKKIKFIKSGNFNINNIEYIAKIKGFWRKEKADVENRIATYRNPNISELEQAAIDNNYYLDFIDNLSSLFRSVSYTNAESLRNKILGQNPDQVRFVTDIKKDFGWKPAPPASPKPVFNEKYILYSLISVLAFVVLWLSLRKPETGADTDTIVADPPPVIDLGLSVLWADRNIGANSPTAYGDYFAWGETKPKKTYSWDNYKLANGGDFVDVAVQNLGNGWRMPTFDEYKELLANCDRKWTTKDGVNGCEFTSRKNGNKIFFPAAGWKGETLEYGGSNGSYWSSSVYTGAHAWNLYFNSGNADTYFYNCKDGFSVRAVRCIN